MNPEQIWQAAQEELRFQLSKPSYETWLKNASLVGRDRNDFRIGVPTKLAKDLIGWSPKVTFVEGLHKTIDWYFSTKDVNKVRSSFERMLTDRGEDKGAEPEPAKAGARDKIRGRA